MHLVDLGIYQTYYVFFYYALASMEVTPTIITTSTTPYSRIRSELALTVFTITFTHHTTLASMEVTQLSLMV